jgi:monofunctional glycosyltransferase
MLIAGFALSVDLILTWIIHAPRLEALATEAPGETSYMRRAARDGHPPRDREWTVLADIAPVAACAVIESEDAEFFNIGTLNYQIQRQVIERMLHGDFSGGGSGFAQQLARNLFLGPQRTVRRKVREYLLAWQLSHGLTKDRQLELYLNLVEWGDGVWGIGAASRHYFGVAPSELKPTQAVVLATMLPAPRRGLAFAVSGRASTKQLAVLRRLSGTGLIDDLTRESTADRLSLWRAALANGHPPAEAKESADRVMGPEPPARALIATDRRPLGEACQARRRPN